MTSNAVVPTIRELIRIASPSEETSSYSAPDRYWFHPQGKVTRERELWPLSGWTCYIVLTAETGKSITIPIEADVTVLGGRWSLRISATIEISCPQRSVARLIHLLREVSTVELNSKVLDALEKELREAAEASTSLASDEKDPQSGVTGSRLRQRIEAMFGLSASLRFRILGRESILHTARSLSVATRLSDYAEQLTVSLLFDLDEQPSDEIRAVATASRLHELDAAVSVALARHCASQVVLDDLYDAVKLKDSLIRARHALEAECATFGRRGSFIRMECLNLPEIPCRNPEITQDEVQELILLEQASSISVKYSVVFNVERRSTLLAAMRLRPGLRFTDVAREEARAILTQESERWTVEKVLNERNELENVIEKRLQDWTRTYGITATRFRFRTPLDHPEAETNQVLELCDRFCKTGAGGVALRIRVIADVALSPSHRRRSPVDLKRGLEGPTNDAVAQILATKAPETVIKFWNSPDPTTAVPIADEIRDRLVPIVRSVAETWTIEVKLEAMDDLTKAYDQIASRPLDFGEQALEVDSSVTASKVALSGNVVGLTERGWADLMAAISQGKMWNPVEIAARSVPRLFELVLVKTLETHVSTSARDILKEALDRLSTLLADETGLRVQLSGKIKSQVQNIVFLTTRVETATATVPVQLTVAAEVSLDPLGAARNEESARAEFDTGVAPALRDVLRSRTIAAIAQYWAAPEPRDVSLREQLETRVQRWLDLVASKDGTQRSVRIQINGIVDARAQYSTVIGTLIEIKDCNLTRNGVPISATAVVQVRVIDLADLGWQKLLESSERGEKWHPDIELQARVRSGVQDAFEVLVSKRAGDRPSKDSILVELSNTVEGMIRSDLGLICRISIAFNSPPEVVDYFRKTTEERKHAVERHFNRRKNIVSSLEHNEDQRLRCLTRGQSPDSEEVLELQKIIDVLEAELTKHDSRGDALESQFADAQWLLLVLSSPETRKLTGSSGERQKLID